MKIWNARSAQALMAAMLAAVGHAAWANSAIVYYKPATSWTTVDIHYGINGTWTTPPGVAMDTACTGWKTKTVDLGTATTWLVTFNNGSGTWDNNGGKNYTLGTGVVTVNGGVIGSTNPCDVVPPSIPTNLTVGAITASTVALSWTASTDNVGVAGYDIYRNGAKAGSATTTTFTDSGLSASTSYSYTVLARDAAGNASAQSTAVAATTSPGNTTVVYYKPAATWTTVDIHYGINGTWTTPPGVAMALACTGWYSKSINLGSASSVVATFNNGAGTWDNNGSKNYTLGTGNVTVSGGVIGAGNPCQTEPTPPTQPTNLTSTGSTTTTVSLSWTASTDNVGVAGYDVYRDGNKVGTATGTTYTDSNLTPGTAYSYTVDAFDAAGNLSTKSTALSVSTQPGQVNTAAVYYYTGTKGWSAVNIHYGINSVWTTPPGVAMNETACTNWVKKTVTLGSATSMAADFNNGTTWDNNNSANYTIGTGTTTVKDGVVTSNAASPCVVDPTPPSVPTGLSGTVSGCTVSLTWTASTDNVGVTGYKLFRNGTLVGTTPSTTYTDSSLAANTTYTYALAAFDAAANVSAISNPITVTTGTCTAPEAFHPGVIYTPTQSTFSLWSPDSANVALNLNGTVIPMSKVADTNGYTNMYSVVVPGDQNLKPYNFQVNGVTTRDPYGVMVQAGTNNNIVLDMSQTALPSGWSPTPALTNRVDSIIYETHVRDFSIDASSGVPAALRGTYAAMTLAGTTVNATPGAPSTGIDHLVDMGVTHVQIMPVYDFGSCSPSIVATNPGCYNWGYDPVNYNVPEERYSQTPNDYVARVKEFKAMVDGFHKRGIRVIMDVVYNHTFGKDVLGNITSKYYTTTDLSGTGNSLDGSQPMVARMIRDSLEHWVKEYNVDGFRFDLLGVFDTSVVGSWGTYLNATFPDRNLLLYGEPWVGGSSDANQSSHVRFGSIGTIASSHFGVFNGAYRGALKNTNDNGGGSTGFMFNQGTTDSNFGGYSASSLWPNGLGLGAISAGIKASPLFTLPATVLPNAWDAMFTAAPEQSINYIDVHDNLCLADKVSAWASVNGQSSNTAYQTRLQQYALSMILTSQGIPLLHGGSEMQRTKQGDANSYQSPDSVNAYNWNLLATNAPTYSYVKKLIALRKAHPGFRFTTWADINTNVLADQRSASLVYTQINAAANSDSWSKELVIFNSGSDQVITLPSGNWSVAVEQSSATAGNDRVVSGSVTAAGTSVTVLHQ